MTGIPSERPRQVALPAGTMIEQLRIDRVLGTGSFGITYEAWDTRLERRVALKEYFPGDAARRDVDSLTVYAEETEGSGLFGHGLARFLDEARTLARFRHPNVVGVQQYIEANGTALLVMDHEEGEPLSTHLRQRRPEEAELVAIAEALLAGLREVHREGILHRDIKPANVLVRADGSPVLLDFGAARQVAPDKHLTIVLTPRHAPIEQYASDQAQGPWTDLYALGATLFHAITGRAPMLATERLIAKPGRDTVLHSLETLEEHYSEDFLGILAVMLRPDPDVRPRSAEEVIEMFAGKRPIPPRPAASGLGTRGFQGNDEETLAVTGETSSLTAAQLGMNTGPATDATLVTAASTSTRSSAIEKASGNKGLIASIAVGILVGAGIGVGFMFTGDDAATPTAADAARAPARETATVTPAPRPSAMTNDAIRFSDRLASGASGPSLVAVAPGDFLRGSPADESGRDADEGPQMRIRIAAPFALGETEVTVSEFSAFVDATGYVTVAEQFPEEGCNV